MKKGRFFWMKLLKCRWHCRPSCWRCCRTSDLSDQEMGRPVKVDVRILAASTTSVESAISENKLREDLYYRLSAYTIHVPPLRQRREEVPLLLRHFMQHLAKRYGLSPRSFSPGVLGACQSHSWPGNLRELENFVKRYLMAGGKEPTFGGDQSEPEDVV